jgi:hypothetical protein
MIATNAPTAKAEQSIEERFDHLSQNRQLLIDLQAKNIPHRGRAARDLACRHDQRPDAAVGEHESGGVGANDHWADIVAAISLALPALQLVLKMLRK